MINNSMMRQEKRKLTSRRKGLLIFGGVLACFLLGWIFFAPNRGLLAYWEQQSRMEELAEERKQLVAKNAELAEEIRLLRMDEAHLERVAREKHGLLKKNESVYQFRGKNGKEKEKK